MNENIKNEIRDDELEKEETAMNEEIKNNQIPEDELENVSGGFAALKTCPKCGGDMMASVHPSSGSVFSYCCIRCRYVESA